MILSLHTCYYYGIANTLFPESECLIHFEKKAHICALGRLHTDNNDNWFYLFLWKMAAVGPFISERH